MSTEPKHLSPVPGRAFVLGGLLLAAGLAWALYGSAEQQQLERSRLLERRASESALVLQGRLQAVLGGARFAAARLKLFSVREPAFCRGFMADLVASQPLLLGGAVLAERSQRLCESGQSPAAPAPWPSGSWQLQHEAPADLAMHYRLGVPLGEEPVLLSLRLDAAALTQGIEPEVAVIWSPAPAAEEVALRPVRLDGETVAWVQARPAAADATPALRLQAVAAVLAGGMLFTAFVLHGLNRRRQRDDSRRLIRIARDPDEAPALRPHMRDGDLAAAAQIVADEQRQLRILSEQLGHAKARLEEVQRAASMGAWRFELGQDDIDWTDQAREIFGVPADETFNVDRLMALVHPDDREMLRERRHALLTAGAEMDLVHRIERPGGEERVVHVRATVATRDNQGQPKALVGTVQDVTEAWEASGLSDALAHALARSADAVLLTREHAGIWLWAWSNRAWDRLCEQLHLAGREAHHQLFHPELGLLRAHADRVRAAGEEGKVLRVDLELTTAQGLRWFEVELIPQVAAPGRAGHGLLLLRDRTLERQAARALGEANARLEQLVGERTAALARSEQQYRVLADLSPQILWQSDREGQVLYFNRAWYELVGPREGGWLGMRWLDALHPEDRAATMAIIGAGLEGGRPWQARRRVRSRNGLYRSFLGVAAPVMDAEGAIQGWVGVEADITELEQHSTRLQQLNAELETFSSTVSHDLRAPVHVIKGFVEALLSGQVGQVDEQARHYLERVLTNARRMDELIGDLLALARLSRETLQRSPFDVVALARGLLEGVRERYPGRTIELQAPADALVLDADRRLFQVLLENLLDNAAKFTAARPVCQLEFSWQAQHDELVLELADNGVGFPPESAHRLFKPYQRLHAASAYPGHGIGLATVARIVQLHGGSISAHNRPQGGAVFRILLPAMLQAGEPGAADLTATETP